VKKWSPKPRWSLSRSDDWVRLRHVLVHDYSDVDDVVVLDTVRVYLPSLAEELKRVLDEDGA